MALRWLVVAGAAVEAGYMVFDGLHALTQGDYVTPSGGDHAGELGPWAAVVAAVGIEPRSAFMKWLFVLYGVTWLAVIIAFVLHARWAWWAMIAMAVGSLWYLVPGTVLSVLALVLLLSPAIRAHYLA